MANVLTGTGQLGLGDQSAGYAEMNANQAAMGMFKGARDVVVEQQELMKKRGIERDIAQTYVNKQKSGQPMREEDIMDVYARYGDTEGVERMQNKIYDRKLRKAATSADVAMKQLNYAMENGNYKAIQDVLTSFNSDPDHVDVLGKINWNPNLGTLDRKSIKGETITLPDGSQFQGTGNEVVSMARDKSGNWMPVKMDTKQADALALLQAKTTADLEKKQYTAQQKAVQSQVGLKTLDSAMNELESVFAGIPGGLIAGTSAQIEEKAKKDTNVARAVARYNTIKGLTMSNLARNVGGEKGVLTEQDIARIESGYPQLQDPPALRKAKIDEIRYFINQRIQQEMQATGAPTTTTTQEQITIQQPAQQQQIITTPSGEKWEYNSATKKYRLVQ